MRLIDADELIKALDEALKEQTDIMDTLRKQLLVGFAKQILSDAPTVEAVPVAELPYTVWLTHDVMQVVRCKDCEFSVTPELDSDEVYCSKHDNWFKLNGYCHLGKEKDAN